MLILVSLIVIFVAQLAILFSLRSTIYDNNMQKHNQLATEKTIALDRSLSDILNSTAAISRNPQLLEFYFSNEYDSSKIYQEACNVGDYLFDLVIVNDVVMKYIVYLGSKDVIIAPDFATVNTERYFSSTMLHDEISYSDWVTPKFYDDKLNITFVNPSNTVSGTKMIITRPLNVFIDKNDNSFIEVSIDFSALSLISQFSADYTAMMITDESGNILYGSNAGVLQAYTDETMDSGMNFFNLDSSILPISYAFAFESDPAIAVIDTLFVAVVLIIILLFLLLTIGLIVSNIAIKTYLNEVTALLNVFDGAKGNDQLGVIKESISGLTQSYSELNAEYNLQVNLLRSNLITQLVHSSLNTEAEAVEYVKRLQFEHLITKHYIVVCGKIPYEASITSAKDIIIYCKKLFRKYGYVSYMQPLVNNRFCILIGKANKFDAHDIGKPLAEMTKEVHNMFDFRPLLVVGTPFSFISYLQVAYYRGLSILDDSKIQNETNIIYISSVESNANNFCIPIEIEGTILTLMQIGNFDKVEKIFDDIFIDAIPNGTTLNLTSELRALLIKIIYTTINSDKDRTLHLQRVTYVFDADSFEHVLSEFKKQIKDICEQIEKKKSTKQENLVENVRDFIATNYTNPDMCRSFISDKFDISEKHLSRLFKAVYNETIISYIEDLRMKKAIEFIMEDKLNIYDIGYKVGFINHNTFYKAFKRKYLISPSEYRAQFYQKNDDE